MKIITAHSGCDNTAPNSREFIEYALNLGAECFEVDVRKDGEDVLMLSHDKTEEKCLTLKEAFEILAKYPNRLINCDLKEEGLEQSVLTLAKECKVDKQLIFTGAVNPKCFTVGREDYKDVSWYVNAEIFVPDIYKMVAESKSEDEIKACLVGSLDEYKKYNVKGINWHYKLARLAETEIKEHGLKFSVWTVDDESEISAFIKDGVENITTRNLKMALNLREKSE